ncbi:efflux ABC transporter, permease protein [Treponema primitia ZAS-2]|uniref:Efflux ABC transporter, permease protein n=1 Tax=Treponema primitia (strain ATCC BAA-887 / DSM 12427 / ZAS-2) TaxID=545694 RepID=F5YGN0_TREPZ|nr:FtsX-like permease family protein [Treponema primitia]AEF84495.1 efflux ABC transporter, permease protein [Treponema primitia ZAS-2]
MKFLLVPHLAMKYLFRYRRRYLFLFLALTFSFGIVTFITSIKDGMYENIYNSAQSHYAGDIIINGYDKGQIETDHIKILDMIKIGWVIKNTKINPARAVMRTLSSDGILYFNGSALSLKYTIGVDWNTEKNYFDSLVYQERQSFSEDKDTILLSVPVAKELGVRLGDSLVLGVKTRFGQSNTGVFVVRGIVEDSTLFGYYKAYVSRPTLNRLFLFRADECSSIGLFFNDRRETNVKKNILQKELEKNIPTAPLVQDRDELIRERDQPWNGVKIFVLTIPVYLSEVADLLGAINIITYFLYLMMMVIILVSAMVTYNLILHERSREMGTMRAIGFHEADVRHILILETLGLGLLSLIAGFIFAFILSRAVQFIPLSWFPSFEIFMKNGRLTPLYLSNTMLINLAVFFSILMAAIWLPAFRSSRNPLPGMLSGGND